MELALKYFPSSYIPLVVGAPLLNRFMAFGNLFARVGRTTYRVDRHPTMSKHPVTPMTESDLRVHLGKQTSRKIQLMDKFALVGEYGEPEKYLTGLIDEEINYEKHTMIFSSNRLGGKGGFDLYMVAIDKEI